jgi:DNA-binding CsgD family transcriptional regulator
MVPIATLTPRELDVLRLMASGYRNGDIAEVLRLSSNTIESHARRLYRKLEVRTRAGAIASADAAGWLGGAHRSNEADRHSQTSLTPVGRDVVGVALKHVVDSLSLVVVYGELLQRSFELPLQTRDQLAKMLADVDAVAPGLQLLFSTTVAAEI